MRFIKTLFVALVVLGLWYITSRHTNPLFLPKPEKVWQDLVELTQNGMLAKSAWISFYRITLAVSMACLVSIPIGLLTANYKVWDRLITPFVDFIRYVPPTVFFPLLIIWAGIGETMKISFLFIVTFFFFIPTVVLSVKETPQDLVDTAYTMGMNSFQVMSSVLLPYSLPAISLNFLLAYGVGWTYVIIVEVINSVSGLGHIINLGTSRGRTDLVFAAVFVIIAISVVFDVIGRKIIRKAFPWKFAREISGG